MGNTFDDFVGRKFGKDNQLTVMEWDGVRNNGAKYYSVKCSTCAEDSELFGEGVFRSYKATLLRGQLPCGCGKGAKLTQEQLALLIDRMCLEMGNRFNGFVGEWRGVFTKISQTCGACEHTWNTGTKPNLSAGQGCPECSRLKLFKTQEVMENSFKLSGAFKEGTTFWRHPTKKISWSYSCPVCSNDEYVQNGLCNGVFTATAHSLQLGHLSCRCCVKFNWTQAQREYQIKKVITEDNLSVEFMGWKGEYKGSSSKIILRCHIHGEWDTCVNTFTGARGSRCPDCAESGYRKSKPGNLYVMVSGDVTKVGITNRQVKSRLNDINRRLPNSITEPFKVIYSEHFTDGKVPRDVETSLKKFLNVSYLGVAERFDGYTECFLDVDRENLISMIQEYKLAA